MAEHTPVHRAVRDLKQGVRSVAKSSPVIAAGDALASVGEFVIKHTPESVKQAGRRVRRGLTENQRLRRHRVLRRKARRMRDGT